MRVAQRGICACGCGRELRSRFIAEHFYPVALGNAAKPDSLWREDCADEKTNGLRGDKSTIARVKRHANGKTQYDKRKAAGGSRIKGRGFDKTKTRGFDGKVKPR